MVTTLSLLAVCPTGYYFHHVPRKNSRGGGVGLLFKKRIKIKEQSQEKFKSFEYTDVTAKCSNGCTRIVIIYQPPPSKSNQLKSTVFFDEFSTLAEQLVVTPGNPLIIGDFNYHVDDNTKLDTIKFKRILESFNLRQHFHEPTHKKGHTLDLIITRVEDELITRIEIKNSMLSDHLAVDCKLRLNKPQLERTEIQYRKLKSIDMVNFNEELKKSDLILREHNALPDLINKYEETLKVLLDTHAPMK